MDDLRSRLQRVRGLGSQDRQAGADGKEIGGSDRVASLRARLARLEQGMALSKRSDPSRLANQRCLDEVLRGRVVLNGAGVCYEVPSTFRKSFRHGDYCLEDGLGLDLGGLEALCGGTLGQGGGGSRGSLDGIRAEDLLFLDTETTGLAMGTGTYVFLLGMGFFRDDKYCLHQFFLRDFTEEAALLSEAMNLIRLFRVLVTFNGRRFDVPLLETRLLLQGMTSPFEGMIDWDLLYPSRRLWRGRLEDCRLETLEGERLGVTRGDREVVGADIPGIYYRFIHSGDTRDLDRIAYHNAMDILSLTTLLTHLDRCLGRRDPKKENLLSLGRFYERRGMGAVSVECYEMAGAGGVDEGERNRALFRLACRRRRDGRVEEAVGIWEQLIDRGGDLRPESCIELAKVHEHVTRQLDRAIEAVRMAESRDRPVRPDLRIDLEKRLKRLERKRSRLWGK